MAEETNPFLKALDAFLPNPWRQRSTISPPVEDRIQYPVDEYYERRINMPQQGGKLGWGEWLDAIARTLSDAAIMRGGVSIPDWAAGKPPIKRLEQLKSKGILNEAEYEQGVSEFIKKEELLRQAQQQEGRTGSIINQLERIGTKQEAIEEAIPGVTYPAVSSEVERALRELPSGYTVRPSESGSGFALDLPDGTAYHFDTIRQASDFAQESAHLRNSPRRPRTGPVAPADVNDWEELYAEMGRIYGRDLRAIDQNRAVNRMLSARLGISQNQAHGLTNIADRLMRNDPGIRSYEALAIAYDQLYMDLMTPRPPRRRSR